MFLVVLMLVMMISVSVYLVYSSCPNACGDDINVRVSIVFLVVLMLVMVISVSVYLLCF